MKSLMPLRKKIHNLLNNQEYGRVLNNLPKVNLDKLDKKEKSNYRLIKGILWEILGNLKSLESKPDFYNYISSFKSLILYYSLYLTF